ncbi:MAG: hypothetical protein ABIS06_03305 [Vicinamibacterales bacterium]
MLQKRFVLCSATALLALAVACSKSPDSPAAPGGTAPSGVDAAADGSTLKVTAPTPQSPINGAQPDSLSFTAGVSTASFATAAPPLSYEFEIRDSAGTATLCTQNGTPSGNTVTITPTCNLALDTAMSWRVRAVLGAAKGPWSSNATFKSPLGGYNSGTELYDPLYNGKTVGRVVGSVTFTSDGARLNENTSHIRYQFPTPLTAGEFSVMVKGADEGSPGDKSKIFSMQQGDDGDITTNSYRFTAELRGNNYSAPGSVSCRMITGGDNILDCSRVQLNFDSTRWYFWKLTWNVGGSFTQSVRRDGPNGALIYSFTHSLNGRTYRPTPHNLYIGAPVGRAGPLDATLPGGTYRNLWVSSRPRPAFPGE